MSHDNTGVFESQQAALRAAFAEVGVTAVKPLVISAEQRHEVGLLMQAWYEDGRWAIKADHAKARGPYEYTVGQKSTDLIKAWELAAPKAEKATKVAAMDPIAAIKAALAAGLISAEKAEAMTEAAIAKMIA